MCCFQGAIKFKLDGLVLDPKTKGAGLHDVGVVQSYESEVLNMDVEGDLGGCAGGTTTCL